MPTVQLKRDDTSEAAIFGRVWESEDHSLSPELARHVLRLRFSETDRSRMGELAARNKQGRLTLDEAEELDNYVKVGDLIAILQSKARKLLKKSPRKQSS